MITSSSVKTTVKPFLDENFLLENHTAAVLYHEYAKNQPIIDYHCHLPPDEIAQDKRFDNLTRIWLNGDHYKWRAMRTLGIPEAFVTGAADDFAKFENGQPPCLTPRAIRFTIGRTWNCAAISI